MTINEFNIENHPTCDYDFVMIINEGKGRSEKICGCNYPEMLRANELYVIFLSDASVVGKGFKVCLLRF